MPHLPQMASVGLLQHFLCNSHYVQVVAHGGSCQVLPEGLPKAPSHSESAYLPLLALFNQTSQCCSVFFRLAVDIFKGQLLNRARLTRNKVGNFEPACLKLHFFNGKKITGNRFFENFENEQKASPAHHMVFITSQTSWRLLLGEIQIGLWLLQITVGAVKSNVMGVLLTVAGKPEKKVVFIIEIITDKVLSPGCDLVDQKQLTPLLNKLRAEAYHNI